MSYYVRIFPGPCDPRTPCMGGEELNGFLTPPAQLYFFEAGPATPVTAWTYDGPKGGLQLMPAIALPFITADDIPRFVVWELSTTVTLGGNDFDLVVRVEKKAPALPLVIPWDTYWTRITLDGLQSDNELESLPSSSTVYTLYSPAVIGDTWTWNDSALPTQRISFARFYPMAWDRILPGPPFPS